jgi:eukaryotic-like serine/threonine-protein kinase
MGETEQARAGADAGLRLAPNRNAQLDAALALALVGDSTRAEKLADELSKRFPVGTLLQRYSLPTIRAAVALERKNADQAIQLLQVTTPYELAAWPGRLGAARSANYMCGQAYLRLHNPRAAAAEFQKIRDHRGVVLIFLLGALARVGLGRAYAMAGDTVKAKAAYQDFLALWKDADPDIPILKEARAEYEKVQ